MNKANDYKILEKVGLPIPIYDVFGDANNLSSNEKKRLKSVVDRILSTGSGYIGLRTEPKQYASALGNYPHIMPLQSVDAIVEAMQRVRKENPQISWWFLVNEAFTEYLWSAVVMLTDSELRPGGPHLVGEVNTTDNLPLRDAMERSDHCIPIEIWHSKDSSWLRSAIARSGLLDTWLEVTAVRSKGKVRRVFWGMR